MNHTPVILLAACLSFACGTGHQGSKPSNDQIPIETTLCAVLAHPSQYNNRIVTVQAFVDVSEEYSTIEDERCPEGVWLALADGSSLPGLETLVSAKSITGSERPRARLISLALVRNEEFTKLLSYLKQNVIARHCTADHASAQIPDCTEHRISAVLTGRIDAVSEEQRAAHLKHPAKDKPDFKGFGQMGLFDVQLVLSSVKNVTALDARN